MSLPKPSTTEFDKRLEQEYRRVCDFFPSEPESIIQSRFAEYEIFPQLGWSLIGDGEAEAIANDDPAFLGEVLSRFVKCADAKWGQEQSNGIHSEGYDYCALVVTTIYSSLLGKSYLKTKFYSARKPSIEGYAAYKHAANLIMCLEHQDWPYQSKVIKQAIGFVQSKSASAVDRAFVHVFIGLINGDTLGTSDSLLQFNVGYLKSDWGKHKPHTRSTFLQALMTLANSYLVTPIPSEIRLKLFSSKEDDLWQRFHKLRSDGAIPEHIFKSPMQFLNSDQALIT